MARYKTIDTSPTFLAVVLSEQLLPGTCLKKAYSRTGVVQTS